MDETRAKAGPSQQTRKADEAAPVVAKLADDLEDRLRFVVNPSHRGG